MPRILYLAALLALAACGGGDPEDFEPIHILSAPEDPNAPVIAPIPAVHNNPQ